MKRERTRSEIIKEDRITRDGCDYHYTLECKKSTKVASYRLPLYSVKICFKGKEGDETECSSGELFTDVGRALVFYRRLVDNLATPINLPYIVEDELV